MINNRQGGRRRGRGGQRSQGGNPGRGPDNGNRIDNRARGNAAQLLEKYKTLARDAQMQGDRVNTEYYLQFADHYFRVLAESRSRFEDNQQRRVEAFDADDGDDFDGADLAGDAVAQPVRTNGHADAGFNGGFNGNRAHLNGDADDEIDGNRAEPEATQEARPRADDTRGRRGRRPRREASEEAAVEAEAPMALEADRLPPALGIAPAADDEAEAAEPAPKPRRRRRTAEPEVTPAG